MDERTRIEKTISQINNPADIAGLVSFLAGPDGEFMSGAYVLMDGGLRDARGGWDADDESMEEMARHMAADEARRQRLQPLLDERD